jgi:hypothetical protein
MSGHSTKKPSNLQRDLIVVSGRVRSSFPAHMRAESKSQILVVN